MAKPFFRQGIPLGSTLTIQVTAIDGDEFGASGVFEAPDQTVTQFTNAQLTAGAVLPLNLADTYAGKVDIVFAAAATARLHMEVLKPDGTRFIYDAQVTRPNNLDRTHIMLTL